MKSFCAALSSLTVITWNMDPKMASWVAGEWNITSWIPEERGARSSSDAGISKKPLRVTTLFSSCLRVAGKPRLVFSVDVLEKIS